MNFRYPVNNNAVVVNTAAEVALLRDGGFGGTARWDDLRVPAEQLRLPSAGIFPPEFKQWRASSVAGGVGAYGLHFDDNQKEYAFFSAQLPHTWVEGTPIRPHIHWSPITAAGGNVVWRLEWTVATFGAVFPLTTLEDIVGAATAVAFTHDITSFTPVAMVGNLVSTMLIGSICRNGNEAGGLDTYVGDCILHELDFHILVDSTGSEDEFIKTYPS